MEVLRKTRQGRKARINVESMVAFDGVSQYASAGVNQNVVQAVEVNLSWSISVFANFVLDVNRNPFVNNIEYKGMQSGGGNYQGWLFRTLNGYLQFSMYEQGSRKVVLMQSPLNALNNNRLYHFTINYDHTISFLPNRFSLFINGIERLFYNVINNGVINTVRNNDEVVLGAVKSLNNTESWTYGKNSISHLTFFNRTLTPQEIQYIHAQGGLLPASTHEACVAHYPMTHREGNTLYDVVEQYNYAKATALVPYHATLQNFTAAQHTGDAQSAWKDFYTKQDLRPYVDTDQDGTPDSPLIEKTSGLPPLLKALPMTTSPVTQSITCSDVGTIQGVRLAVKLDAVDQALVNLNATNANTAISVSSGSLSVGSSITGLQIYVDGIAQTAADAGAILNDLKLHDLVLLFDSIAAPDFRVPTAEKHIAALFIMAEKISRKDIIKLANNNLLAQPSPAVQAKLARLYNFNEGIDTGGPINLENMLNNFGNAVLSGYTSANFDSADPAYVLTDINSLR